jgi:hypothetical protein
MPRSNAKLSGRKPVLRPLDAAQLASVAAGMIIHGSTATDSTVPSGIRDGAIMFWSAP